MVIKNKKTIGIFAIILGLCCIGYMGSIIYKMVVLPFTGTTTEATVIGYKIKGSKFVSDSKGSGSKTFFSGRSPFFEFTSTDHQRIKTYSHVMQVFILFNYDINDKIKIAYPKNDPQKAIILNWKEIPGILFIILFGALSLAVGISQFKINQ